VPDLITSGTMKIRVNAQLQDSISEASFTIGIPVITDISASVTTGSYISIKGKNFHPEASYNMNRIFFNGVETDDIKEASTTELKVRVPAGAFPDRKAKVSVKVFNGTGYYAKEINIADKWLMISADLPFEYGVGGAFTLKGAAYVFAISKDNIGPMYLWKFDPSDASWDKIKAPANGRMAVLGDKAYLYANDNSNNFIEFDPVTGKWTARANFPGVARGGAAMFSAGGQVYIGIGMSDFVFGAIEDFYRYDPSKNEWAKIANFPGSPFRNGICSFVIGSSAYLVGGATNSGQNDVWSYDTSTDKWIRKADFPPSHGTTAFVLNGKGYYCFMDSDGTYQTNECWQYDPANNIWSKMPDIGIAARQYSFSFVLNGKAYAGGKTIEYYGKTDLYRIDGF